MKQFLITSAAVVFSLTLFFIGLPIILLAGIVSAAKPAPAPGPMVLTLDLRQGLADQDPASPLGFIQSRGISVVGLDGALRRAASDNRVKGLLIRLPEGGAPPASADELAADIRRFRRSGKPVIAFSQGIYPSGVTTASYLLGAASGAFWMQENASLQSVGVSVEETFYKRAFDKFGVKADFQQRYEYKNAVNPYLYDDFTPAHREAELGWLTSVYEHDTEAAAADRRLAPAALRRLLEAGPYGAEEAAAKGLIDHVGDEHQAEETLLASAGEGAKLVDVNAYRALLRRTPLSGAQTSAPKIALIQAEGEIVTGGRKTGDFSTNATIYSDDLSRALYDAAHDGAVKAIVLRISSPGGSDTASEQILTAMRAAKAAGKPVVVSMGVYAASGGYWVSCQASRIVAEPTTLTGSIGVFGGKLVLGPALARFGVDLHDLSVGGDFASAYRAGAPFTPGQRARISAWMDHIYNGFVERVAVGRRLPVDRVRAIAKGRVWTGAQALKLGLVDQLGGLEDAIGAAKQLAGLSTSQPVILQELPRRETPFEAIQHALGAGGASLKTLMTIAAVLDEPRVQSLVSDLVRAEAPPSTQSTLAPGPWPR